MCFSWKHSLNDRLKTMACRGKCLSRFVITLSICIFTFHGDCLGWKLQTDSQSITVENGVESNIDFFLTDYRSLNVSRRLIVQHRSSNGVFSKKCQIEQSAKGVCQLAPGPCECVGESSGSFRYRLRMTFTEQDGGQWMFVIVNHEKTFVNVTVVRHQSTEPSQVTVITPPTIRYTLLTVVLTSTTTITIIITISLVAILRRRSRSQRALMGETGQRVAVAESPLEDPQQYDDPGGVEQGQCEVQSSMTVTPRDMQSASHLEPSTEASDTL